MRRTGFQGCVPSRSLAVTRGKLRSLYCRYPIRSRELKKRCVVVVIVARQKVEISRDIGVLDFCRG